MSLAENKKKALLVSNIPPFESHGGGIRTLQVLELLIACNYEVDLYLIYPVEWGQVPDNWVNAVKEKFTLKHIYYYPIKNRYRPEIKIVNWLRQHQSSYKQIIFRYELTAFKCGFYFLSTPVIIDYDDFSFPIAQGFKERLRTAFQLKVAKLFNVRAFVVQKEYLRYWTNNQAFWLPNLSVNAIYNKSKISKGRASKPTLLAVGFQTKDLLDYIRSEWGKLKESIPELELFVVSRNLPGSLEKIDGVYFFENVEDLLPFYKKAWALLLVSKQGYGTHIKIMESILYKTPVIALENSIRGYEELNRAEDIILTSANFEELNNVIVKALLDKKRIEYLAEEGYSKALHMFSFSKIADKLKGWITSTL